jgi:hypothetical protein
MTTPEKKPIDPASLSAESLREFTAANELTAEMAVLLLRRVVQARGEIELLLKKKEFHNHYDFRLEVARHPHSPAVAAVMFLRTLYWRDQFDIAKDARAAPLIRRTAIFQLQERIPEMTLGERISLGRVAIIELIPALMKLREEQVLLSLLDNPRMRESDVVRLIADAASPATLIARVARHVRWSGSQRIRQLLARDPRLQTQAALRMMSGMPESELDKLAGHPETSTLRVAAAQRLSQRKARIRTGKI